MTILSVLGHNSAGQNDLDIGFFSTSLPPPPLFKENVSMHKHLNNTMPQLYSLLKCRPPHKVPDYVRRLPEKNPE